MSSQQFMHRESTATLEEATTFLADKMEKRMGYVARPFFPLDDISASRQRLGDRSLTHGTVPYSSRLDETSLYLPSLARSYVQTWM